MAELLHIRPGSALPLSEIELRTSRSSGPGGQHANVTASRVEAMFDVAASASLAPEQRSRISAKLGPRVTATAQDTRSQHRNRELALERLASRLAHALEVRRPRTKTRPTRACQKRGWRARSAAATSNARGAAPTSTSADAGSADPDQLLVHELVNAEAVELATEAGSLHAAERELRAVGADEVDKTMPASIFAATRSACSASVVIRYEPRP